MMDQHRETYRVEATELLSDLETALLNLEKTPDDEELVGQIFRAMHTIKGSGAMFGFDEIASFTHDLETIYDRVRNREIKATKALIDLTLKACDHIKAMVRTSYESNDNDKLQRLELLSSIRNLMGGAAGSEESATALSSSEDKSEKKLAYITYRIRFKPQEGVFANGTRLIPLLAELHDLGTCRVIAHTQAIPCIEEIIPENCYTAWDIILTTKASADAIRDIFIFVEDVSELKIDTIDEEGLTDESAGYKRLGEILLEKGDISEPDLKAVLSSMKKIGEVMEDAGLVPHEKISSALAEQEQVREVRSTRQAVETSSTVRVPAERLDSLVNMVGELVTLQSRLTQTAAKLDNHELSQIAEEVERLIADLRDNTMSIRMLPIGTTFTKFQRLVHDLSAELGKEIALTTEGGETELDKTVIERLNDPLVHLIRNCIDHGIERPEQRQALGKPRQGTVKLSAAHAGAHVLISIADDGSGINRDAVRSKAIEKGLIQADTALTEKELLSLIFAPGFSTAAKVTGVSGRGVGMDVAKRNIDALQGSIDIESKAGLGTTITLKLPLTLAIIDGLLVKVHESFYVMPLSAVEECVELSRTDVENAHGRRHIEIRGEIVPYIHLRKHFRMDGIPPAIEQVSTTRIDGERVGFVVDQVIGQHQTVIKSMGRMCRNAEEVSGATILGDGRVALILDLPKLVLKAQREESALQSASGVN